MWRLGGEINSCHCRKRRDNQSPPSRHLPLLLCQFVTAHPSVAMPSFNIEKDCSGNKDGERKRKRKMRTLHRQRDLDTGNRRRRQQEFIAEGNSRLLKDISGTTGRLFTKVPYWTSDPHLYLNLYVPELRPNIKFHQTWILSSNKISCGKPLICGKTINPGR